MNLMQYTWGLKENTIQFDVNTLIFIPSDKSAISMKDFFFCIVKMLLSLFHWKIEYAMINEMYVFSIVTPNIRADIEWATQIFSTFHFCIVILRYFYASVWNKIVSYFLNSFQNWKILLLWQNS